MRLRRLRRGAYIVQVWDVDHWATEGSAYSARQARGIALGRVAQGHGVRIMRTVYSTGIR